MKNLPIFFKSLFVLVLATLTFQAQAQEEETTIVAGEYTFQIEKPWLWQQPASSMRAGQLAYGETEGAPVAVFFHFAGGGGGIQANLDRWVGQLEGEAEKTQTKEEVNGVVIHLLEANGTFSSWTRWVVAPFPRRKSPSRAP